MKEVLHRVEPNDSAFQSILDIFIAVAQFGIFIDASRFKVVRPWKPDDTIDLTSKGASPGVAVLPCEWISDVVHERTPPAITLYRSDEPDDDESFVAYSENTLRFVERLCAASLISYYEQKKDRINGQYGSVRRGGWPATLRFLYNVRNGLVHNGRVNVKDVALAATWRGITIDSTTEGQIVLRQVIQVGDLPLLLADASPFC